MSITTSKWGDIVGSFDSQGQVWRAPDGTVDIVHDVTAAADKFSNRSTAPIKARCDVEPQDLDVKVNITDLLKIIEAFGGAGYPFTGPFEECPAPPPAGGCQADIRVDSNNDGVIDVFDDTVEDFEGVTVVFNADDDNDNGIPDWEEADVDGEDDLVEMQLSAPACAPGMWTGWSLSWDVNAPLKVWWYPDKYCPTSECPGSETEPLFNYNEDPGYYFFNRLPRSVWLEATDATGEDFEITFTIYGVAGQTRSLILSGEEKSDKVKARANQCTPVTGKILAGAYIPKPWWAPDFNSSEKIRGAAGKITTRDTKLCFERADPPGNPQLAMSVAWVGVDERDSNEKNLRFAQVGYVRTYMYGHGSHRWYQKIAHCVYHEEGYWSPEDDELKHFRKFFHTDMDGPPDYSPPPSGEHLYICELDKSSGTWRYYFDDEVTPFSLSDSRSRGYWLGGTGNVVAWNAEIFNAEDQMVGTHAERCEFSECRYYHDTQGRWVTPEFDESEHLDVRDQGHGNQWGVVKIGSSKIEVWDKDP